MSKTNYAGIDYSLGRSNVDHKTGIHYGVISSHELGQSWYEASEEYYYYECPECGNGFENTFDETCPECGFEFEDFTEINPTSWFVSDPEIEAEQTYDDPDIFITRSIYYTYCQYCSPCAPGAGYLMNWTDKDVGIKTYCFGHDWFDGEKAPYPVYRVSDDTLV